MFIHSIFAGHSGIYSLAWSDHFFSVMVHCNELEISATKMGLDSQLTGRHRSDHRPQLATHAA